MKFRISVCLMAACLMMTGCEKKTNDTQVISDTNTTDNTTVLTTPTDVISKITEPVTENTGISEDAVIKVTQTTYRDGEVWETFLKYINDNDDVVALAYVDSDGIEVLTSHSEYEYDENGKKIYEKYISDSGNYIESTYLSDNILKILSYDEEGRLEGESECTYDKYGNYIISHNIVYDENGEVILDVTEDNSDCDYDENGNILVCRQRSKSGEVVSITTNTYDNNGNMLLSEEVPADSEKSGYYSISHSYKYDDKNNLIAEEETKRSDADTVYCTESYEYQYDENGKMIRKDHSYVNTDYNKDMSEYTIYEYTKL